MVVPRSVANRCTALCRATFECDEIFVIDKYLHYLLGISSLNDNGYISLAPGVLSVSVPPIRPV